MDTSTTLAAIAYLAVFKLAVIAVGGVSIVLGYRLFAQGLFPEHNSSLDAKIGNTRLTLKHAAPGTLFALFGITLIAIMVVHAPAEIQVRNVKPKTSANSEPSINHELLMRGGSENKKELAKTMNALAWQAYDAKQWQQATANSRLSVYLEPNNAHWLDTLATMLYQQQKYAEALRYKKQAMTLEPSLGKGIQKYQKAVKLP